MLQGLSGINTAIVRIIFGITRVYDAVNRLRNRIAHHEPVCFLHESDEISTTHLLNVYDKVMTLFARMDIDGPSLLYGMDHVKTVCKEIESLKK